MPTASLMKSHNSSPFSGLSVQDGVLSFMSGFKDQVTPLPDNMPEPFDTFSHSHFRLSHRCATCIYGAFYIARSFLYSTKLYI